MKSTIKLLFVILALGLLSAVAVHAFALLGPQKDWQVVRIGYYDGDIGGPVSLGEGYRINVPVITYAYDTSFLNYFGTNGIAAVETVIKFMNELPPMSSITNDGVNFYINGLPVPMDTKFVNFEAQALGLWDVKAVAWQHLLEEMGLAEAERWVWALRSRVITPGPGTNYAVVKFNFDPITHAASSFVNGTLYSYRIFDGPADSDALEYILDPFSRGFNTVAGDVAFTGEFFTGLSHDDVGGLRFLYNTNNVAVETLLPTVTGRVTGGGGGGSTNTTNSVIAPWTPIFFVTNVFGTNITGNTNIATTNAIVNAALRPGINKFFFQRLEFDSIVGTFIPRTNVYADVFYTNNQARFQTVQRSIPVPDYVFMVEDLGVFPPSGFPVQSSRTVADNWINNDAINGFSTLGGPGVITPPVFISFTDLYPALFNVVPNIDEFSAFSAGVWGSFDGTTNAPIVYPQGGVWTLDVLRNTVLGGGF
jgi:hypothetical protein